MSLRTDLEQSVVMERQHSAFDDECSALAHLAHSESRWALAALREGRATDAAVYRSRSRWHLNKAREKRVMAAALRARRLRVVS